MGTIFWNGRSSDSVGIVVENFPDYTIAERDYDVEHVPGRNGDLLLDNECYNNVSASYDIAFGSIEKNHSEMAAAVSEWLHSASGYARLEDSYSPMYYRLAYYQDEVDLTNILNHLGRATISFSCMPQRFLKTGDNMVTFTGGSGKLRNPTRFPAKPIITVYGSDSGVLTVNGKQLTIESISGSTVLDSDLEEAYSGTVSKNSFIKWPDGADHVFPLFVSGMNDISFSGGITKVEVIPKWHII